MKTVTEYQRILCGYDLPKEEFDSVCHLSEDLQDSGVKLLDMRIDHAGLAIIPQNYVGVISFSNGDYLEILPKITDLQDEESIGKTKEVFLKMLLKVFDMDAEESGLADLDTWNSNPYEFFISMFLREVSSIIRIGIRSGYSDVEGNETFIRGKILFSQNIRHNCLHEERMYQKYQVFDTDRPENRLIRETLRYLRTVSCDYNNRREIHRILPYFDNCSKVLNIDEELRRCIGDRNTKHYRNAMKWCDIFLHNRTFSTFSGSDLAYTFLFPMDKVFESYVAKTLEEKLTGCTVSVQNSEKTMFDEGLDISVRPDIVVTRDGKNTVLDTKWKIIGSNDDISVADLRQMKEYSADFHGDAVLLYPKVEFGEETVSRRGDIVVKTAFIDLLNDFEGWWKKFDIAT